MKNSINHVAIIMDGNGRWARRRMRPRVWGHVRGAHVVSAIVEEAQKLGIEALTLYAFSTENWSRPLGEIKTLFHLLKKFLLRERQRIIANNIKFSVIGDTRQLPPETQQLIFDLKKKTEKASGLKLTFAVNYGGRTELLGAVNRHIEQLPGQKLEEKDLELECGDVDLMIRTGGDQRISNFLLWQAAYAELFFTKTSWPDFSRKEFREIYYAVEHKERRFGAIDSSKSYGDVCLDAKKHREIMNKDKDVI